MSALAGAPSALGAPSGTAAGSEIACTAGHDRENFAIVRHFALNLLRREPGRGSIAKKRFRAALGDQYHRTVLAQLDN